MIPVVAYERGQTGVVVPFPDLGPVIDRLRREHDPAAALGVPAHVTVTYPFLSWLPSAEPALTGDDLAALAAIAAARPAFEVTFAATGRFPGVGYLRPEPDRPFRELTAALLHRWPHVRPYGGAFGDEPEPHFTIAADAADEVLDTIDGQLVGVLPITLQATGLALLAFDGDRWQQGDFLPFARSGLAVLTAR